MVQAIFPSRTTILTTFASAEGESVGSTMDLPLSITAEQLELLINQLLNNDEHLPYSFFVDNVEIKQNIQTDIMEKLQKSTEDVVKIVFQPQAIFRVNAVSRCSSALSGHADAILGVLFSPDGNVRVWDLMTEMPKYTLNAHTNWVLCISWSPDGKTVVSGGMDGLVIAWDVKSGKQMGQVMRGHSKWITSITWEPFHINPQCSRFATSSKDGTVKIWNALTKTMEITISQHNDAVSCVKWGGDGFLYSASRDKTVKCWDGKTGKLCRTLLGHAHWINTMALSTDFAIRTGPFDHTGNAPENLEQSIAGAKKRYEVARGSGERLVTGSDDFTMFLWNPGHDKKPVARMTGHQQIVNHVCFSPNGLLIASASFDKSIKLWDAYTGNFIVSLRSHVSPVYQVTFSADSRQLLSGSKDSTLKLWDLKTHKLKMDLPGHADEVYTVDWNPTRESRVASGGKDKMLRFWK